MNFKENPVQVGVITKTHGVHGGLVLVASLNLPEPDDRLTFCFVDIDGGLVPYALKTDELFLKDEHQLVLFIQEIDSHEDAAFLLNRTVSLPSDWVLQGEAEGYNFPDLSGYRFQIEGREGFGSFVELIEIPSNNLISIDWQGKSLLIPAQDEFIGSFDEENQVITLILPDGLFDLN